MNTIQHTSCQPGIYVKTTSKLCSLPSKQCVLQIKTNHPAVKSLSLRENLPFGMQCVPILKSWQPLPVCLAGGTGMMDNKDEGSPWKALEKASEKFKGQSIEDVLRQQIEKGEYSGNGGSGGKRPGGGGGGSGGSEEGDFSEKLDETLQIVLATIGFIFMYIYSINGVEITKLTRDYINYLFTGNKTVRLKRAMYKWGRFYQHLTRKKLVDPSSFEKSVHDTTTAAVRDYVESNSDE
ncbi:hypothetical protein L6164_016972 [Bauhinia variegata]|uniref:Uncharacterized protein n=1 Tax=Bauhinia variegata TaxID=167791 RepID=A0ACB9N6Y6_BAUVA|nr:hypothetical protein L6164_016972 [Bauhinia variegata]